MTIIVNSKMGAYHHSHFSIMTLRHLHFTTFTILLIRKWLVALMLSESIRVIISTLDDVRDVYGLDNYVEMFVLRWNMDMCYLLVSACNAFVLWMWCNVYNLILFPYAFQLYPDLKVNEPQVLAIGIKKVMNIYLFV